jgi:hypothetical protein
MCAKAISTVTGRVSSSFSSTIATNASISGWRTGSSLTPAGGNGAATGSPSCAGTLVVSVVVSCGSTVNIVPVTMLTISILLPS